MLKIISIINDIILRIVQFFTFTGGLVLLFNSSSRPGLFLAGITFVASGYLSYSYHSWIPLIIGFVVSWILRLLGLDPSYH